MSRFVRCPGMYFLFVRCPPLVTLAGGEEWKRRMAINLARIFVPRIKVVKMQIFSFLRKFYQAVHTTLGGTTKLETKTGQRSATTMGRGQGSIDRACYQNFNFSSPIKKRKVDFSRKFNFWRLEKTFTGNLEELPGGQRPQQRKDLIWCILRIDIYSMRVHSQSAQN